jgi:hypothetical protein
MPERFGEHPPFELDRRCAGHTAQRCPRARQRLSRAARSREQHASALEAVRAGIASCDQGSRRGYGCNTSECSKCSCGIGLAPVCRGRLYRNKTSSSPDGDKMLPPWLALVVRRGSSLTLVHSRWGGSRQVSVAKRQRSMPRALADPRAAQAAKRSGRAKSNARWSRAAFTGTLLTAAVLGTALSSRRSYDRSTSECRCSIVDVGLVALVYLRCGGFEGG